MVKVTCLNGHSYLSNNTKLIVQANARDAKGIPGSLPITKEDCEKCHVGTTKRYVGARHCPAMQNV